MKKNIHLAIVATTALLVAACGGGNDADNAAATSAGEDRARALAIVPPGTTIPADANVKGVFGPLKTWPLVAVHGVLTSDGRVLSYGTRTSGQQTGYFNYDVWDPASDTHLDLPNTTSVDIFCSSQLMLSDGASVVINGGDNWTGTATTNTGNNRSTIYNVATGGLSAANNMTRSRWYSTATMLLNGEVYIQGGSGGTDRPEVRGTDGVYRSLTGANTSGFDFMYPRNFIAPSGRVFGYDSAGRMYYIDTTGTGAVTTVGQFGTAFRGNDSSAAMFAPGRILQYGGNSNQSIVIDINGAGATPTPTVTSSGPMLRQRRLSVATILPDGRVLATGGSRVWNAMTDVSYEAEIWNPATGQWTLGAVAQRERLYHGNALLLPDASVLVFGGGAPAPSGRPNNLNAEIYYPPYLFTSGGVEAPRPVIDTAPTVVDTGRTVQVAVTSARPISRVTFIKTGSATHGWNMEQRFVDLPFSGSGGTLAVQIPARASDVPPGMWMLFVLDDAGVPSVARMVRVNVAGALNVSVAPVLTSPGNQSSTWGSPVSLQLAASDPNNDPLTYSASGLPPGLSINPATGAIAGVPNVSGTYTVVLAASDGYNSASATITWTVAGAAPLVLDAPPAPVPSQVGSAASFSATATGVNVRYRWDFGDGSPLSAWSSSGSVTHTYANPGVYFVTVYATDDRGIEQSRTLMHNAHLALTTGKPTMSSTLLLEPRGAANARLWAVNQDNDSVTVFDAVTRAKLAEITVGTAPRTLALSPDGSAVWVVNKQSATLSVIATGTLAVTRTVSLPRGSQPYGIAFSSSAALVTLEASGQLLKIDPPSGSTLLALPIGANPRHVAVAADGATAFVSRFITPPLPGEATANVQTTQAGLPVGGEVVVVNSVPMSIQRTVVLAHSDKPDAENQGRGFPNYLGAMAISPDGSQGYVPSKQDNLRRGGVRDGFTLNFQNTVRAISSRVALGGTPAEDLDARIDHDNASLASAAVFDPLGVYLFVALETSREVAVLDAHNRNQLMRIDVGRAPQGLAVSADRRTLYVSNFMDRTVDVFDLTPLIQQGVASATPLATLAAVATERLTPTVLRGKQFFYDARDTRLSLDRYMSCASCHNDGGHDGRTWDLTSQGEGLRNTINLRGRGGMGQGFLHWSNNFDEVQDFEGQIRTLAGGTGLMTDAQYNTGTRNTPLGDAKAGVSSDLDALAAYVASLDTFAPSPTRPSASTLSSTALEGKTLFANLNCVSCHGGSAFTHSGGNTPQDIGTIKPPTSGTRLGGALTGIDIPTLRDVWATAPYLHDGSAPTLDAAIRAHNFVTASDADIAKVAAFLREIGSDEVSGTAPAGPGVTIWPASAVPANASWADSNSVNLGVKFTTDTAGFINGIRFYKGAGNTGTHIGSLWTSTGTLLASATFTNETATGWQQVNFATPVAVAANTTYVASYLAPNGGYALNSAYFASSGFDNPPLRALSNAVAAGNGVYRYGTGNLFPNSTYNSSNYWVDVVFTTSAGPDATPPTVSATSPAAGATAVPINAVVSATFSEAMNATTIGAATFELRAPGNLLVAATVAYNPTTRVATLTPSAPLATSTTYTATIRGGASDPRAKDAANNALAANSSWTFTTAAPPDTTPPTVTAFTPASGATGVALSAVVTATFSEAMNAGTINATSFELRNGSTLVAATVTYNAATRVATLTPSAALLPSTTYTATVRGGAGGVADSAGNVLASSSTWSFTTGAPVDTTPPTVTATTPAAGATGVATNSVVTATFSEPMSAASIDTTSVELRNGATPVASTVSYNATTRVVTLTPSALLAASTTYTVTIRGGATDPRVKDVAGNAMAANSTWSFTTAAPPDTTPPTVTGRTPASGATGVATSSAVTVTFSEAMDAASIGGATFELRNGAALVAASVSYNATTRVATLTPSAALANATTYTATVRGGATGVRDVAGNALAADSTWSFTTAAAGACPCSLWPASAVPANASWADGNSVNLGVKFTSTQAGFITGIRFYKGSGNTGTHIGALWSSTGTLLAQATFTNETATGWQQVNFAAPVAITANTTYVASYLAPNGGYALNGGFFASTGVTNAMLSAPATGVVAGNGVYRYGAGNLFPNATYNASNYWVDVVFTP
jgi:YVTN family beta-propeller protein